MCKILVISLFIILAVIVEMTIYCKPIIVRKTLTCPITGNKNTTIYCKTLFTTKIVHNYGLELNDNNIYESKVWI